MCEGMGEVAEEEEDYYETYHFDTAKSAVMI